MTLRVDAPIEHSATLAANERIRRRAAAGHPVVHLAFGEAGLPVPDSLAKALGHGAARGGYPPVAGDLPARQACAEYFGRRGIDADAERIVLAPGSKALLYALIRALPGDVVLPRPCWVSYAAQAALSGKRVLDVPIPQRAGGVPDPAELDRVLCERTTARPGSLVLTTPDNPTGTVADEELVRAVCAVAREHDLTIISDEIYSDLTHPSAPPTVSPARIAPERTVVTTGLSKNLALGGWRIGVATLPATLASSLLPALLGIGSEVWSAMPTPMQEVAARAFREPPDLSERVAAARRLHNAVANALHAVLVEAGARCRAPQGGFYLYPDFEPHRTALGTRGITGSETLASALLDRGVGVLPGRAFGDDEHALTFRAATSLLYGDTEERRHTALTAERPEQLPWIADALDSVRRALDDLLT